MSLLLVLLMLLFINASMIMWYCNNIISIIIFIFIQFPNYIVSRPGFLSPVSKGISLS